MIGDLLDFNKPNVGYEDQKKRAVCGCCGTYYVVSVEELAEVKEVMSDLYEALKESLTHLEILHRGSLPSLGKSELQIKVEQALAKAEGK